MTKQSLESSPSISVSTGNEPVNCTKAELEEYLRNLAEGYLPCVSSEPCTSSQGLAEGFLVTYYSDTSLSVQSKSMSIASKSYQRGKKTVVFHGSPSFQMSRNLTGSRGADELMLSAADSLARTSALQEKAQELKAVVPGCGATWLELLVRYDLNSCSWKTHRSLFSEGLPWSSVTLPRWGMMLGGACWERTTFPLPTSEKDSGWWPTPCSRGKKGQGGAVGIGGGKRAKDYLDKVVGVEMRKKLCSGSLNPVWSEWYLLGWPMHWTDITPLATDRFREWQQQHGGF